MKQYLKYIGFALLLLVAGTYIGNCRSATKIEEYNKQLVAYQKESRRILAWADSVYLEAQVRIQRVEDSTKQEIDSLQQGIVVRDVRLASSSTQIKRLRAEVVGVRDSIGKDTLCNPTCQSALRLVDESQHLIDSADARTDLALEQFEDQKKLTDLANHRYNEMARFAALQQQRGDTLERELKKYINLPKAPDPDKLFGFIKLPSRTTSFFTGAGIVLSVWGVTEITK